eukprot:TRINITY_DN81372_c0_g1_i1.p1 TRINITY_DN81372_c0_g1~~TRINITY_DN81372_c0_g1_i1.p1  ORF type:complete len:546 (+),score=73.84 TRINITY_DN81372_c0_g1_i1:37-1674(+)
MLVDPVALLVLTCASAVKLLLFPAYRSTDFEVHRNWLAVTYNTPVLGWYADGASPSEWTLDYPPFFAWFEWVLAQFARLCDPAMLDPQNLNYASQATVVFQRSTVVLTDFLLFFALRRFFRPLAATPVQYWAAILLVFLQPGLLMVDHIHFQYNGFLFGLLVLSFALMQEHKFLPAGVTFAVLLNFKHIFLYTLPAVFVWLLRFHCFAAVPGKWRRLRIGSLMRLSTAILAVFGASLGPYAAAGRLPEVLRRLFPFGRGLCHAYWAPNFWALYNIADKALCHILAKLPGIAAALRVVPECRPLNSRGLVGTSGTVVSSHPTSHSVLPNISPQVSIGCVALGLLPALALAWSGRQPCNTRGLLLAATLSTYAFFLFGWHVHEKAALMLTVPLLLLAATDGRFSAVAWKLVFTSTYSMFPLLFNPAEWPIRWSLWLGYAAAASIFLPGHWSLSTPEIIILPAIEVYTCVFHPLLFGATMEFLPLLIISVVCAAFMVLYWWQLNLLAFSANKTGPTVAKPDPIEKAKPEVGQGEGVIEKRTQKMRRYP